MKLFTASRLNWAKRSSGDSLTNLNLKFEQKRTKLRIDFNRQEIIMKREIHMQLPQAQKTLKKTALDRFIPAEIAHLDFNIERLEKTKGNIFND